MHRRFSIEYERAIYYLFELHLNRQCSRWFGYLESARRDCL